MQHRNRNIDLDERHLRLAFDLFVTGVTVVAAEVATGSYAVAVNTVRALSLDSALVLLCPRKASRIGSLFRGVERFTVNVLGDDQRALATLFSGRWRGRSHPPFQFVASDAGPRLSGAPVSLGCVLRRALDLGAHSLLIAQVVDVRCDLVVRKPLLRSDPSAAGAAAAASTSKPSRASAGNRRAGLQRRVN